MEGKQNIMELPRPLCGAGLSLRLPNWTFLRIFRNLRRVLKKLQKDSALIKERSHGSWIALLRSDSSTRTRMYTR